MVVLYILQEPQSPEFSALDHAANIKKIYDKYFSFAASSPNRSREITGFRLIVSNHHWVVVGIEYSIYLDAKVPKSTISLIYRFVIWMQSLDFCKCFSFVSFFHVLSTNKRNFLDIKKERNNLSYGKKC